MNNVISVISNMIRSAVSVHLPESYCSLHGFAAHSQRSLRQFDGECTANPRRLLYDSWETSLRIERILNRLKKFCSLAAPPRMRWDSENWKMFNLQWSRSQIRQSVRAAFRSQWVDFSWFADLAYVVQALGCKVFSLWFIFMMFGRFVAQTTLPNLFCF